MSWEGDVGDCAVVAAAEVFCEEEAGVSAGVDVVASVIVVSPVGAAAEEDAMMAKVRFEMRFFVVVAE